MTLEKFQAEASLGEARQFLIVRQERGRPEGPHRHP